ncbi:flagellar hook-length control protein FliK [Ciceribacter azotifigens]|uniref:flagellar hook-length control protein FliK n=1 Tax=Ciceribacter azotifigens TaxID=2069303 RepID=UPI003A847AA3
MIDIGITGTLPSTDATGRAGSAATSARSTDGGFSEALEGAERRGDKAPVDDERPRPRVEISRRSLRERPVVGAPATKEEIPEETDTRMPAKAPDRDGKEATAAFLSRTPGLAKSLHETSSVRGEVTGRRVAEPDKAVARGPRSATGREVADVETDQAVEDPGEVPATDAGEVLSLLSGTAETVPADAEPAGAKRGRTDRSTEGKDIANTTFDTRVASAGQVVGDTSLDTQPAEAASAPETDAERTFRFARLDGKGQSLTMRVSESGEAAAAFEPGAAPADGAQTVAVLDARRYLAPVSTTNTTSIAAALAGDGEWVQAMQPAAELANAAAAAGGGKVVHTLKIQMTPVELGSVTANLRLRGDELTVHLTVENHAALRQLNDDQSDILKALRAQGLTVDHVHVSMAPSVERAGGDGSQGTGQSPQGGQQAQQGGGQGAGGGPRQDAFSSSRGEDDGSGRIGDEAGLAEAAGNGGGAVPGGARPDHVYL